jgi:hypothetical protein
MNLPSESTLVEASSHEGKHGTAGAGSESVNFTTPGELAVFFRNSPTCSVDHQNKKLNVLLQTNV